MVNAPPQKSKAPTPQAASASALELYSLRAAAQVIPFSGVRPCASCGVFVGNINLGGYDGPSALTGELFCLNCADGGTPL